MSLGSRKIAPLVALAIAAVGGVAQGQQKSSTAPLQVVPAAAVSASNGRSVGTDASGRTIVQTTDPSILTENPFPYRYGNVTNLPGYTQPNTAFSVQADGTFVSQRSVVGGGGATVPGVSNADAAAIALADTSGGGCAMEMCALAPHGVSDTPVCGPILDDLANLLRNGRKPPSCAGSTIQYTPVICAAPWTLVNLGGWENFACQAVVAAAAPCVAQATALAYVVQLSLPDILNVDTNFQLSQTNLYTFLLDFIGWRDASMAPASDRSGAWNVTNNIDQSVTGFTCSGSSVLVASGNGSAGDGGGSGDGNGGTGGTGTDGNSSGNAGNGNAGDAGAGGTGDGP